MTTLPPLIFKTPPFLTFIAPAFCAVELILPPLILSVPLTSNIGLLSYDEVVYAGGYYNQRNSSYYLYNSSLTWWTMSPAGFSGSYSHVWYITPSGGLYYYKDVKDSLYLRSVINLKTNSKISSGDGTKENPFVVE